MGKSERYAKHSDSVRRYFLGYLGEYLENEFDIDNDWYKEDNWKKIVGYFDNQCIYCGCKKKVFEKEHLDRIADGGIDYKGNVVPACKLCNTKRGTTHWEEYIRIVGEQKRHSKKKIKERIEKVWAYRKNECKWDIVSKHPIYTGLGTMVQEVLPSIMNNTLRRWADNWAGQAEGNSAYIYHITDKNKWDTANSARILRAEHDNNSFIPCCYENQLETILNAKFRKKSNLVLLSFSVTILENNNIYVLLKDSRQLVDSFPEIIGDIDPNLIHDKYENFHISKSNEIYPILEKMKDTLTSKGKKFW
ncbi:HNH endonuclease [Bacillus cereus]|uniref:HNH endonuclease n=1 Tax=Bacillus cereus TaxID=1396 RepID=UPI001C8E3D92|nr:HNH endonuclease signature motif containing protein [Bacillus cereus]MBY0016923.1 HNH endonuclease [Bacillus cereus]